jgi:acyl-coenzyme A thioesterase PaaI-like protein
MSITHNDRGAEKVFGVWEESMAELISYRHVGCQSVLLDRTHADGRMRLRSDLRAPGGPLTAPLAIAALDAAGNILDRHHHLALTHITVDLFEDARDVAVAAVRCRVVRETRSQVFTEATFVAADDPRRVLGYSTADWTIVGPTPPGFDYRDPGEGPLDSPDAPPLWEVYHGHRRADGGFGIDALSPAIGADVLHHGPIMVVSESAAFDAAAAAVGTDRLAVDTAATRIVAAGRQGPFSVTVDALRADRVVPCRVEVRDEGRDDRVVAVTLLRLHTVE